MLVENIKIVNIVYFESVKKILNIVSVMILPILSVCVDQFTVI